MYLYLKCNVKWGIQNIKFKVVNQHKNYVNHVQSLEKDFYLGALGFFDHDFTPHQVEVLQFKSNSNY
jgi:hypothetical protein